MNAADPGQVQIRERQEKRRLQQQRADLQAVLALPEGRRVFQWLFDHLQPEGNLWSTNAAITGFNACRMDVALFVKDVIDDVDPEARLVMMKDRLERQQQEQNEMAAYLAGKRKPANSTDAGTDWE
jgi:hypothetical protein